MNPQELAILLSIALFIGLILSLELGYRVGHRGAAQNPESAHEGIGVIEAAVFALLGLLLAFAFAGGTSRLDARRHLVVREANAIGTAYLRLDLLPATDQPALRRLFREYLVSRLRAYGKLPDLKAADLEFARARELQEAIWSSAVTASRDDPTHNASRLLLPALNEMIDVTTARTIALHTHLPALIFALLMFVALLSGVLAGYAMAKRRERSWVHLALYAVVIAATIFVILELEYPRYGLINLRSADRALVELQNSIR